jgi:hypothetical protein
MEELSLPPGEGVLSQNRAQFTIDDITTQILITSYLDRHFVIVTQLKKFGTLVCSISHLSLNPSRNRFLRKLFGRLMDL